MIKCFLLQRSERIPAYVERDDLTTWNAPQSSGTQAAGTPVSTARRIRKASLAFPSGNRETIPRERRKTRGRSPSCRTPPACGGGGVPGSRTRNRSATTAAAPGTAARKKKDG